MGRRQGTEDAGRLVSLDAYRGLVMLAMASGGFALTEVARNHPDSQALTILAGQFEHVPWRGCSFWDLIQPSFMFIVGVAMPFSYASRADRGDGWANQFGHALRRSIILVLLAVFLSSAWSKSTNWVFVNVLAQIGLGYPIVFLLLGKSPRLQFAAALGILAAYWLWFAAYPLPTAAAGAGEGGLTGFLAHWEKHANPAAAFDRWFLNLFPRPDGQPFTTNDGGYATLNFVPSIATMLFGVIAGEWLRSSRSGPAKVRGLLAWGVAALAVGMVLDVTLCPVVKRIWTPSWAIFSAGWTLLLLGAFHGLIDVAGYRRWAFPMVVVGVNSIAFYVMAQLMKPFVAKQLAIHLGPELFGGDLGPLIRSAAVLGVFWLIALAMYRQRIFVRI
ncbi:MAG: acyltransferase family protein [Isosphaeraceae bacterium]